MISQFIKKFFTYLRIFNTQLIHNNYIISILLFLLLVSLFLFYLYNKKTIEGFNTDIFINQVNLILNDTTHDDLTKINAIKNLIIFIDNKNDQKLFNDVINNTTTTPVKKLQGIKDIIQNLINTPISTN